MKKNSADAKFYTKIILGKFYDVTNLSDNGNDDSNLFDVMNDS